MTVGVNHMIKQRPMEDSAVNLLVFKLIPADILLLNNLLAAIFLTSHRGRVYCAHDWYIM